MLLCCSFWCKLAVVLPSSSFSPLNVHQLLNWLWFQFWALTVKFSFEQALHNWFKLCVCSRLSLSHYSCSHGFMLSCIVSFNTYGLLWTNWFLSGSDHLRLGLSVHFLIKLCWLLKQLLSTNVLSSQVSQTNILPSWGPRRNQATTN